MKLSINNCGFLNREFPRWVGQPNYFVGWLEPSQLARSQGAISVALLRNPTVVIYKIFS